MVFQKENANEPQNMKNSDGKNLDIVATLRHHQHPQSHAYNHKQMYYFNPSSGRS